MDDENNIPSAIEAALGGNISRFNDSVADTLRQKAEDAVSAKFDEVQYNMFAGEQEEDEYEYEDSAHEEDDTEYDDSEITDEEIDDLMSEYEEDDHNDEETE